VNVGTESIINYDDIIKKLAGYDKIVFVGGIAASLEGEEMPVTIEGFKGGDRTNIELPAVQRNFLKALKAAGKKVIYVNCSGSAIGLQPETESCDAIVQAWYPGMKGGEAVADVLYGKVNPSGKLPITFYKNSEQLGDFEDYNMAGRTYRYMKNDKPLYPFGYGLSYTDFEIGNATLSADKITKGQTVTMTIPVTNKGKKDGTEVVQVYVKNPSDPNGPIKQLRAYKRVDVKAGQTVNATITINDKSLEWFDEGTNTIHTKEGSYELVYGNSSDATKAIGIKVE
jgi:beta-glucosidase